MAETISLQAQPNGKAEPRRRVCGTTTLDKSTIKSKKPRYNGAPKALSARYSRQRNPFLHPWFRTGRETFDLIRLLSTRAFVTGTPLKAVTHPRSLAHALSELDFRPVFSALCAQWPTPPAIRPRLLLAPVPSRVPALRLPIPGITLGLRFLGHPTPSGLTAWSSAPEPLHFVQGKL
jgi:hypothetical protein